VKQQISAINIGRGERIRTSGPCLPNALLQGARVVLRRFSLAMQCRLGAYVPVRFTVESSTWTFGPCASASDLNCLRCQHSALRESERISGGYRDKHRGTRRERMRNRGQSTRTFTATAAA
jgi:hypothetical protein